MFLRIWSDRMNAQELEDISNEMEIMHKSMKNVLEIVFASSPLLALSTRSWSSKKQYHSTYLLRVSEGLVCLVGIC